LPAPGGAVSSKASLASSLTTSQWLFSSSGGRGTPRWGRPPTAGTRRGRSTWRRAVCSQARKSYKN
jgi:hypothetical protein